MPVRCFRFAEILPAANVGPCGVRGTTVGAVSSGGFIGSVRTRDILNGNLRRPSAGQTGRRDSDRHGDAADGVIRIY
jgi:hypothetical protein